MVGKDNVETGGGGKVWLDYSQKELDDQYNQRKLVPDADEYMKRHGELSANIRGQMECRLDVSYGPSDDEKVDIFPARQSGAPVVVYYHGGAWTRWHKDNNSYQAPAFVNAGATFVPVNFALVPQVTLDELVRQCRAAVAWVYNNAKTLALIRTSSTSPGIPPVVTSSACWRSQTGRNGVCLPTSSRGR